MGIFSSIKEGFERDAHNALADSVAKLGLPTETVEVKDYDYSAVEAINLNGYVVSVAWTDNADYAAKSKALLRNSISKACINMRAISIGNIDILVKKGNKEVKALLDNPNFNEPDYHTALRNHETSLSIAGDLFWLFDLRVPGAPRWYALRSDFVFNDPAKRTYTYDPTKRLKGTDKPEFIFTYDATGKTTSCRDASGKSVKCFLQHVRYFDPRTSLEGAGAGDTALRPVDIMNGLDTMIAKKAKAGGAKAGFFQINGQPTDADMEAMRKQFAALNPEGSVDVLPANVEFNAAQLTFQEMGVLELRNQMAKDICSAFSVPAELVNEAVSTYANARGKDKIFYRNFIGPEAHFLVGQLQAGLRAYVDPSCELEVDETSIQHLEDDRIEKASKMAQMKAFKVNEIRAAMGFEPLTEGGDEIVGASVNMGQPEEKPKGPVGFNADAGDRGDDNDK